jgi:hypothetical protein
MLNVSRYANVRNFSTHLEHGKLNDQSIHHIRLIGQTRKPDEQASEYVSMSAGRIRPLRVPRSDGLPILWVRRLRRVNPSDSIPSCAVSEFDGFVRSFLAKQGYSFIPPIAVSNSLSPLPRGSANGQLPTDLRINLRRLMSCP